MRLPIALVLGLLLAQTLAAPGAAQDTPPVTWWGPQGDDGWHARVAVTVHNPLTHAVDNMPVRWELNVATLLRDAGWPTRQLGDRVSARGFTLDPTSFRVVEYTNFLPPVRSGDGVPRIFDTLAEGAPRFVVPSLFERGSNAAGAGAYDDALNPAGVLTWIAAGETPPNGTRHYYVYFDRHEAGARPAMPPRDIDAGRLDGQYYLSRGTLLFGYGSAVNVTATEPGTEVTVHAYTSSSRIQPHEPSTRSSVTNPFRLSEGSTVEYTLGARPVPFVLTSTRPIVAVAGAAGFVPSLDDGLAGTSFAFRPTGSSVFLIGTGGTSSVQVSTPGRTQAYTITASTPWVQVPVAAGSAIATRLLSGAPYLIQDQGGDPVAPSIQIPSIYGAPASYHSLGAAPFYGDFRVTAPLGASAVRVWSVERGAQIEPPGSAGNEFAPPRPMDKGSVWVRPLTQVDPTTPISYEASRDLRPVLVYAGAGPNGGTVASALGGAQARVFDVPYGGAFSAFAYHNDTLLKVAVDGGAPSAFTLNALNRLDVQAGSRLVVESTKAIALLPRTNVGALPGTMPSLPFQVEKAEVRGAAVSLRSLDAATEPVLRGAGPGSTAVFRFSAQNLGRDTGGSLTDALRFSVANATLPWDVTVEPEQATLKTGESATFDVLVDVPANGAVGRDFRFTVRAASSENTKVVDEVRAIVVTRTIHEVALAFQEAGGPKSLTASRQPGQALTIPVAVTNRGSANDTFDLALRSTSEDFVATLGAENFTGNVTLTPGSTLLLPLRVETPLVTRMPLATIELAAQSRASAAATDKLLLTLELREEGAIVVEPEALLAFADPGTNATINVSVHNNGNLPADLSFGHTTVAPSGWGETRILYRGVPLTEINDLPPSALNGPLNLTVEVAVPANATAFSSARVLFNVAQRDIEGRRTPAGSVELLALARREMRFEIDGEEELRLAPGARHELVYRVMNGGNGVENVTLSVTGLPAGWVAAPAIAQDVAPGGEVVLRLPIDVPASSPPAALTGSLEVRTQIEGVQRFPLQVAVVESPRVGIALPATHRGAAGLAQTVPLTLTNAGNALAPISVQLDVPEGWTSAPVEDVTIPLGAERVVPITFTPRAGASGEFEVGVRVAQKEFSAARTIGVFTVPPAPRIAEVLYAPEEGDVQVGQPVLISLLVENPTAVDLPNVVLDLRFDGKVVDQVTIENLPAQSTRVATLRATPQERVESVEVVLDPEERFSALAGEDRVVALAGSRVLPIPGAGALLLLGALLIGALARRR